MCGGVLMFICFFQAEDGIRDRDVTGVQTCALPISGLVPVSVPKYGDLTSDSRVRLESPRRLESGSAVGRHDGSADDGAGGRRGATAAQSFRNAITGSTRAARSAGASAATAPVTASTTATAPKVTTSHGCTPTRNEETRSASAIAPSRPTTRPTPTMPAADRPT